MTVVSGEPSAIESDLLAVPVFGADDSVDDVPGLAAASGGELARARESGEFRSKPRETVLVRSLGDGWRPGRLIHVAARTGSTDPAAPLREAAAVAARAAARLRVGRIAFVSRGGIDPARAVQAAAEGLVLGCFEDRRYKSDREDAPLRECVVVADETADADLAAAAARGRTLGSAANVARELGERAEQRADAAGVRRPSRRARRGSGRRRGDPRRRGHPVARHGACCSASPAAAANRRASS